MRSLQLLEDGVAHPILNPFKLSTEIPDRMTGYRKLDMDLPDWRTSCLFVDRDRRRNESRWPRW